MESRKSFRILKFKKSKPVLKISGISKSYGHRMVLKKINTTKFRLCSFSYRLYRAIDRKRSNL